MTLTDLNHIMRGLKHYPTDSWCEVIPTILCCSLALESVAKPTNGPHVVNTVCPLRAGIANILNIVMVISDQRLDRVINEDLLELIGKLSEQLLSLVSLVESSESSHRCELPGNSNDFGVWLSCLKNMPSNEKEVLLFVASLCKLHQCFPEDLCGIASSVDIMRMFETVEHLNPYQSTEVYDLYEILYDITEQYVSSNKEISFLDYQHVKAILRSHKVTDSAKIDNPVQVTSLIENILRTLHSRTF